MPLKFNDAFKFNFKNMNIYSEARTLDLSGNSPTRQVLERTLEKQQNEKKLETLKTLKNLIFSSEFFNTKLTINQINQYNATHFAKKDIEKNGTERFEKSIDKTNPENLKNVSPVVSSVGSSVVSSVVFKNQPEKNQPEKKQPEKNKTEKKKTQKNKPEK